MTTFACKIDGCDHVDSGAHGWCRMHYMRWWKHGDPLTTNVRHGYVGDAVSYSGAHIRVRSQRGKASALACVDCGRGAEQWAYNHTDPNEKHDKNGRPYSPNPDRYDPMCIACHKVADLARIAPKPRKADYRKQCEFCDSGYLRGATEAVWRYEARRYCSPSCANEAKRSAA